MDDALLIVGAVVGTLILGTTTGLTVIVVLVAPQPLLTVGTQPLPDLRVALACVTALGMDALVRLAVTTMPVSQRDAWRAGFHAVAALAAVTVALALTR